MILLCVILYDNINKLFYFLDEPVGFMEDYVNVSSFTVNNKQYQLFAVYDGHGGNNLKTGIKKEGKYKYNCFLSLFSLINYFNKIKDIRLQNGVLNIYQ